VSPSEDLGGSLIGIGRGLGVDRQREARIAVTESGLSGLDVDAFLDEPTPIDAGGSMSV